MAEQNWILTVVLAAAVSGVIHFLLNRLDVLCALRPDVGKGLRTCADGFK